MTNSNHKTIASKLKFESRAFINGKYVDAIEGNKFNTINPATGEVLCEVAKYNAKWWILCSIRATRSTI